MSHKDRLTAFSKQEGFGVTSESDVLRAVLVPCVLADGSVGTCSIETSCDPATKKPDARIGGDVHAVLITVNQEGDGLVYHADGTPVGSRIGGDGKTWSNISIRKGSRDNPKKDESANELIHRYAKQIIGAAYSDPSFSLRTQGPFKIPNTFEARASLGPVQDRVRGQRVAIIGLGGTGSYVLDLVAKTPVKEIHLLDSDEVDWHNLMRAPAAPTDEEIEAIREGRLAKVDYYHPKYTPLRYGIFTHALKVDSPSIFAEFLSAHPIDFAFVCIDQLTDGDSARQDVVYSSLSGSGIPFVDSGVSITLVDRAVKGSVTTSYYAGGSAEWEGAIPNAKIVGDVPGYRNVQLPEVNALAASLAVLEWRRRTGQYVSKPASFLHRFRLEGPSIVTPQ